jgi:hypothetical protein
MAETIALGERQGIPVVAQPYAYLTHQLGELFATIAADAAGSEVTAEGLLEALGRGAWEALCVLIPSLPEHMPEHEFRGYSSREAMDLGEFDADAARKTPTVPQLHHALETGMRVNGLGALSRLPGMLREYLSPNLLRAILDQRIAEMLSPSSPSTNGALVSTSASASSPTEPGLSED